MRLPLGVPLLAMLVLAHGSCPTFAHAQSRATRGNLTADQIRVVLDLRITQVQRCYEEALRRTPAAEGRVTVEFVVAADGTVTSSAVANSTLNDDAGAQCIAAAVRTWQFPTPNPSGPVSVRFPFTLSTSTATATATTTSGQVSGTPRAPSGVPFAPRPLVRLVRGERAQPLRTLARDAAAADVRMDTLPPDELSRELGTALLAYARYETALRARLDELDASKSAACSSIDSVSSRCVSVTAQRNQLKAEHDRAFTATNARLTRWLDSGTTSASNDAATFLLAEGLEHGGDLARGLQLHTALVERFPESPYVAASLAVIATHHVRGGRMPEAIAAFERIRALPQIPDTDLAYALVGLGHCQTISGSREAALDAYERASVLLATSPGLLDGFAADDRAAFERLVEHRTAAMLRLVPNDARRAAATSRWSGRRATDPQREALELLTMQ